MRKAAESAAKFVKGRVDEGKVRYPVPYKFVKGAVDRNVKYAKENRGVSLDPQLLLVMTIDEMKKLGLEVALEDDKPKDGGVQASPVDVEIGSGAFEGAGSLAQWMHNVLTRAIQGNADRVRFSAEIFTDKPAWKFGGADDE